MFRFSRFTRSLKPAAARSLSILTRQCTSTLDSKSAAVVPMGSVPAASSIRCLSTADSSNQQGKACLLYSGGLDTSVILHWLISKGYDVVAFMGDLGQEDDFEAARSKALGIGASSFVVADMREDFLQNYVWPAIQANGAYENVYLMGTAIARPCISKHAIQAAIDHGCSHMSHGATGKGNDQVRFELSFMSLKPDIRSVVPWRDSEFLNAFQGRQDMLDYSEKHGIPVSQTKKAPYSIDSNMVHNSFEAGVLEDPDLSHPEGMFKMTNDIADTPAQPEDLIIEFNNGIPVKVINENTKEEIIGNVSLFQYLNKVAGIHGVGRDDIVENRFVGVKSRGCYETPALTVLRKAHVDLEGICLDREVRKIRDSLSVRFAEYCYNGFWFSPEMDYLKQCIALTQDRVTGSVNVRLYKGSVYARGRSSPFSLYDKDLVSMDIAGGYTPEDAGGFININAIRLKAMTNWRNKNN